MVASSGAKPRTYALSHSSKKPPTIAVPNNVCYYIYIEGKTHFGMCSLFMYIISHSLSFSLYALGKHIVFNKQWIYRALQLGLSAQFVF